MCVMLAKASHFTCFDLETERAVAEPDAAMINGHQIHLGTLCHLIYASRSPTRR